MCSNHDKYMKIVNPKSGLVLDGDEDYVTIEKYKGKKSQQWRLECAQFGRFLIVNRKSGLALDVEGGIEEEAPLITYAKHGGLNQQWHINGDGTIESPEDTLCIDINRAEYHQGNNLIIYPKHLKENQIFRIEYI